ncbi:MAG: ABC transporter permease [Prevotella sp.]|nr:ABC transporter permease [Prevotella sp.]
MNLVWKLLRQHVSVPQLIGFFFANLCGMLIVLLGFQFYRDVLPVFTQSDSFMGAEYVIVSKKITAGNTLSGRDNSFASSDVQDMEEQPFADKVGKFTSTEYKVAARMGINGTPVLSSELFFESVPDGFVDVSLDKWQWKEGDNTVPIILPRTYIAMYNFGFAHNHSLPKISDGLVGMIDFKIFIHGNGRQDEYKGKVIGFSSRLNSILVPQAFMDWSNATYAPGQKSDPTRLIVEVANPADERIAKYIDENGLDTENNNLDAEKTTYFLKMVVTLVMAIGLVISVLSFYILMLSIYLLVQKNASKLENLLLIGYGPSLVAMPYQLLTIGLNLLVLVIAWVVLAVLRGYYMEVVETLFPDIDEGSMMPSIAVGLALFALISVINVIAVRRKVMSLRGANDKS